jgi:ribosomal protein L40E
MMTLFGWKRPDMVSVYSHLSMRDVDDKDLILHGLKTKEDVLKPLVQVQRCLRCNEENAPIAIYCAKCGNVLPDTKMTLSSILQDPKFIDALTQNQQFIASLKKALKIA